MEKLGLGSKIFGKGSFGLDEVEHADLGDEKDEEQLDALEKGHRKELGEQDWGYE